MRISIISFCVFVILSIMVLHRLINYPSDNLLHEKAENKTSEKNKDFREEAVQETKIEAEKIHMPLLRQLKSPDVSIIY